MPRLLRKPSEKDFAKFSGQLTTFPHEICDKIHGFRARPQIRGAHGIAHRARALNIVQNFEIQFGETFQIKNHQTLHHIVFAERDVRRNFLENTGKRAFAEKPSRDIKITVGKAVDEKFFLCRDSEIVKNLLANRVPAIIVEVKISDDIIRVRFLRAFPHFFQTLRVKPIVAVQQKNPLRAGTLHAEPTRRRHAAVGFVEDADARIARGVFVADCAGIVRRAVVHENQLEVRDRLREHALDALGQILFDLVDGNDY